MVLLVLQAVDVVQGKVLHHVHQHVGKLEINRHHVHHEIAVKWFTINFGIQ